MMRISFNSLSRLVPLVGTLACSGCAAKDHELPNYREPEPRSDDDDSDDDDSDDDTSDDDASGGQSTSDGIDDSDEPICDVPSFAAGGMATPFNGLVGSVVDEDGKGVSGTKAQACGTNICFFSETDDIGQVNIVEQGPLRDGAFKYGDGKTYAQFALALPSPIPRGYDVGKQVTFALPPLHGGKPFVPGETVTSGEVSLKLARNTEFAFDTTVDEDEEVFLAARFTGPELPQAAPTNLVGLFYLAPVHTLICPPAQLTIPNASELEPGTEVEFIYHDTSAFGDWATFSGWRAVAKGKVSEDGSEIVTDPDDGLPVLGAIGVRPL